MKIVYCINTIDGYGGIDRVVVTKANILADVYGVDITFMITDGKGKPAVDNLSPKVHVIHLNVGYYNSDFKSKFHLAYSVLIKPFKHYRILKKELIDNNPDVIISVGTSEKIVLPFIDGNWVKIREYHFPKNFRNKISNSRLSQLWAPIGEKIDEWLYKKFDHTVVLTYGDLNRNWKGYKKVSVIPNFIKGEFPKELAKLENHIVIAVGRLVDQKNYPPLIRAFRKVVDLHPDWILEIYGEGCLRNSLQSLIDELHLQNNVFLKGNVNDISQRLLNSSIHVMSSQMEGFPLVLLESMPLGLPVVSFDCEFGPSDIIMDGDNGFLVPLNDERKLAERICQLIENPELRKQMGQRAREVSKKYTMEYVMPMWIDLFEQIYNKRVYRNNFD